MPSKGQRRFTKAERLKRPLDFQAIIRCGAQVKDSGITLYYVLRNPPARQSRIGIVVSKRAIRHAVDRNQFKRVVREFFRTRKQELTSVYDLVVRPGQNSTLFEKTDLKQALTRLWERSRIQ